MMAAFNVKLNYLVIYLLVVLGACWCNHYMVVNQDGTYNFKVSKSAWLHSGPIVLHAFNKIFSTQDGSLKMVTARNSSGQDDLGDWNKTTYIYVLRDQSATAQLSVKTYQNQNFHIFEQKFSEGLQDMSKNDTKMMNLLSTTFPSFDLKKSDPSLELGMLAYASTFFCLNNIVQPFHAGMPPYKDGIEGGPLVIFDKTGNAIVISPFSQFMAASSTYDQQSSLLSWGLMGSINEVPAQFSLQTIIYFTDQGINKAMEGWGRVLRHHYKKDAALRYEDPTVKYLGYYTDNGAYYYHKTEPGLNYEETLLAVFKDANNHNIPYRYYQYDDWWYPNDGIGYGGAISWEPLPQVFPHGLQYIYNITRRTVIAHNRYWSAQTIYAKQNGGPYEFFIDGNYSLPLEQVFWDDLFSKAVQWGLSVYEQDWLVTQAEMLGILHRTVDGGRKWLVQMGEAASRYGLRIQYCMALPRHVLQSLEIPAVTQVRSSIDYIIKPDQWQIGVSSMLADAVGLAPFKDTFWTSSQEPGEEFVERNPELEAVVSLLSTGPVGPGDRLQYTNGALLLSLATADGLLLKPSKPATVVDDQLLQKVFGGGIGPLGPVMTTYCEVSRQFYGIIFSADLNGSYAITPTKAGFGRQFQESYVYSYREKRGNTLDTFSDAKPLQLFNCTHSSFCLYYTTPVLNFRGLKVAVLGELDKKVPWSPQRMMSVDLDDSDLQVTLTGSQGEQVTWYMYVQPNWLKIPCTFPKSGQAVISLLNKECFVL